MEIKDGKKLLQDIGTGEPAEPLFLVTSEKYINLADDQAFKPQKSSVASDLSPAGLEELARRAAGAGTIIALGGEEEIEAARYAAAKNNAALIVAPAVLCGERLFRNDFKAAGPSAQDLGEKPADLVLVDYSLVWAGDEPASRASAGDVLSIATAVEDWKAPGGEPEFDQDTAIKAMEILTDLLDRADDIFDLTEGGIKALVELAQKREEFARAAGSRRPIQGSEHLLAECARAMIGNRAPRCSLVCLGVVLMTELQGKSSKPIKQFLHWIRAPWKPQDLGITRGELGRIITSLPGFAKETGAQPSVLTTVEMNGDTVKKAIEGMEEPLLKSSLQDRKD